MSEVSYQAYKETVKELQRSDAMVIRLQTEVDNAHRETLEISEEHKECKKDWEKYMQGQSEVSRLRAAVEKYGTHDEKCDWWNGHTPSESNLLGLCTCGLQSALTRVSDGA